MALPAQGVYTIETAMSRNYVMDVSGDTSVNKANVQIYTRNGGKSGTGNHQRFILRYESGYKMLITGRDVGMAVEVYGKTAQTGVPEGSNVSQYDLNMTIAQQFQLQETTSYNGQQAYYIASNINTNKVMDVQRAITANMQNIYMHTKHANPSQEAAHGDNQKWFFHKDALVRLSLPIPANLSLTTNGKYTTATTIYTTNDNMIKVAPCFLCNGVEWFQFRYRYRTRSKGSSSYGNFSSWRNFQNLTSDDGWGDVWSAAALHYDNATDNAKWNRYGQKIANAAIGNMLVGTPQSSYDKMELQIEARSFEHEEYSVLSACPFVGKSITRTITVVRKPNLSTNSFAFTEDGIKIGYKSDFLRNGNTITLGIITGSKGRLTNRTFTMKDMPYDGTITVPLSELLYIPDNAETCSFSLTLTTVDNQAASVTMKPQLAYSSNHGLAINGSFSKHAGGIIKLKPSQVYTNMECHIIFHQDGEIILSKAEYYGGYFQLFPPFNKDYTVMLSGGNGNTWGVKSWAGARIDAEGHLFNFEDTWFRLLLFDEPYSGPDISYSSENKSYIFEGDRRESVYFGKGASVSSTINGIVCLDITKQLPGATYPFPDKCSLDDFHKMRNAKYVVYRDIYGRRYDVGIIDTTENPHSDNLFNVSITMKERM